MTRPPRSIPGLVSVAIAALLPVGLALLLALLYLANKVTYDHETKNALAALIQLYFFLFAPVAHLVGLVVGVVGLFMRGRPKLAAALGAIANLVLPVAGAAAFLFLIGLSAVSGPR